MNPTPAINDTELDLWKKVAANWYDYAIGLGATGLTPVNWNDNQETVLKKIVYYTARIVELKP